MKFITLFTILSLTVLAYGCGRRYTVASGDFCWAIASKHGISLDQLIALNSAVSCNNLQVGASLCVAAGGSAAPAHKPAAPAHKPTTPVKQNQNQSQKKPAQQQHQSKPVAAPSGGRLVSYDQFASAVAACGYARPSQDKYNAFISSHASAGGITTKRELAMFLSEIMHESGGLQFKSEIRCNGNNCAGEYRSPGDQAGKFYFGRGYIQLTWSYNYKAASQALYGNDKLIQNPELVANDEKTAWETTYWFWKANVHSDPGVQRGQLGSATKKINGALECPCKLACNTRFEHYKKVLKAFGVNEAASNAGC